MSLVLIYALITVRAPDYVEARAIASGSGSREPAAEPVRFCGM